MKLNKDEQRVWQEMKEFASFLSTVLGAISACVLAMVFTGPTGLAVTAGVEVVSLLYIVIYGGDKVMPHQVLWKVIRLYFSEREERKRQKAQADRIFGEEP